MIEKSTIRPDAEEVASAWLPAAMPRPSTVQWMASASIMAEAISLNRWVVASSKWLAAQAGQTWKIYLLMRAKDGVTGGKSEQQLPPAESFHRFRQNGKKRHAQERARAQADQGAQPPVRSAQHRAERSASNRQRKGQRDISER